MIKIILEGERELELTGDESISLNYSIADISDFAKRTTSYSKTFNVPGTKANNIIFEHYWELGSDSAFLPNKKIKASLESDSLQIFHGYIQLTKVNRNLDSSVIGYEINFYADLNRFVKEIDYKYISDISNLSGLTHVWNYDSVSTSWSEPVGYGYVYPFLNRNNYIVGNSRLNVPIADILPAIYVKHIIDGIFNDAGYNYECDLFHSDLFKRLIIPIPKLIRTDEFIDSLKFKAVKSTTTNVVWTANTGFFGYQKNIFQMTLDDDSILGFDNSSTYNTSTYEYTSPYNFRTSFKVGFGLYSSTNSFVFGTVSLKINGITVWSAGGGIGGLVLSNYETWIKDTPFFDLVVGDVVTVHWDGNVYQGGQYDILKEHCFLEISNVDENVIPGDTLYLNQNLPKISQIEFFKSIVTMFNLYVLNSKDSENTLIIKSRDDYYENGGVVDWSEKLDIGSPSYFKPLSEISSKIVRFTWQQGTDYLNKLYSNRWSETFGQNELIIDNDFLPANSIKEVKPVFGTALNKLIPNSTNINLPVIFELDEQNAVSGVNNKPIILFYNGLINCPETVVVEESLIWWTINQYPHCSNLLGDLNYPEFSLTWETPRQLYYSFSGSTEYPSENLYSNYYLNTIEEFTSKDSKLFTCFMNLKPKDIANLNFANQIYIDIDGGHYFKLYQIQDYNPNANSLCKVTLLKSLTLVPNGRSIARRPILKNVPDVFAVERIAFGRNNQIIGNSNLLAGKNSIINDNANYNLLLGENQTIKPNSQSSIVGGHYNTIESNNNIVIGTGNTTSINNTSIIASDNVNIVFSPDSATTNQNVSILSSDNIIISGKSNVVILGLNDKNNFPYSSHTYTNGLSVLELTGTTTNVAGIQSDGKVILLPFSAITSGITTGGDSYWTAGTLTNDLKRTNSNNDANAGDTIILHGTNNSGYTPNSVISGSKNIVYGSYFAPYSMSTGIYGLNNIGGSTNTIYGSVNNIHNGFYNLINNGAYNTIVNGGGNKLYSTSNSFVNGGGNKIYSNIFGTIFGNSNRIFSGTGNNFNFIAGASNHITGGYNSILGGKLSRITGSTSTILNGDGNYIIGNRNTIVNGFNNRINQFATNSSIVNGQDNNINNGDGNLIINGKRNTLNNVSGVTIMGFDDYVESSENNILITKNAKITSLTGGTTQMVVADTSGKLGVQTIPTGGSGGSSIDNGINTFTAGTSSFQSVNVTALTINSLTVSASTSLNTLSATTLQVRNLSGGTTRMVVANTSGVLSSQAIPTYTQYWAVGGVGSSLVQNNGYTTANSDYSIVAGKLNSIGSNSQYASILGGLGNITIDNNKYSVIVNGFENNIKDYSNHAFIGTGRGGYIYNSNNSSILNGYANRIYNSASNSESKYNSIIGGYNNKIIRSLHSTILGGQLNSIGINDFLSKYSLVFGKEHSLQANYSAIIGGNGYTLTEDNTVLVPRLLIRNLPTSSSTYLLNANSAGNVYKIGMSGGTGIRVNNTGGLLTVTYTGTSSSNHTILPGLNTYTGGSPSSQTVNVSGLTIESLIVSGSTSLNSLSATTIFSGSTNLSSIFEPKQNYKFVALSALTTTSNTSTDIGWNIPMNAGEMYKLDFNIIARCSSTGGVRLSFSGHVTPALTMVGHTSSIVTSPAGRTLMVSGNTPNFMAVANTDGMIMGGGVVSAITNTNLSIGFNSATSGQTSTIQVCSNVTAIKI